MGALRLLSAGLLLLCLFTAAQGTAVAQDPGPPERFLVFTNGEAATNRAVRDAVERSRGETLDEVRITQGFEVVVVSAHGQVAASLAGMRGVREVAKDVAPELVEDTINWGVDRIRADDVHAYVAGTATGNTGAGVVVAVVDSGVKLDHADLSANTAGQAHASCSGDGACTVGGTAGYDNDGDGHGTGVAGIIAAADNGAGTAGVAPNAKILAVNCMEPGTFMSCLIGVRYVAGLSKDGVAETTGPRARIVNMSWGWDRKLQSQCSSCVTTINTVMNEAWNRGVLLVAAAGNAGNCGGNGDSVIFPARLTAPMPVAATTSAANNARACFSSVGPSLTDGLSAPGASIYGPWNDADGDTTWSGTSAAAPHASGVAALTLFANPGFDKGQLKGRLLDTACDLGAGGVDNRYGKGLVRADRAVALPGTLPGC